MSLKRENETPVADAAPEAKVAKTDSLLSDGELGHLSINKEMLALKWAAKLTADKKQMDELQQHIESIDRLLVDQKLSERLDTLHQQSSSINDNGDILASIDSLATAIAQVPSEGLVKAAKHRQATRKLVEVTGHSLSDILASGKTADLDKEAQVCRDHLKTLETNSAETDQMAIQRHDEAMAKKAAAVAFLSSDMTAKQQHESVVAAAKKTRDSLRRLAADVDWACESLRSKTK